MKNKFLTFCFTIFIVILLVFTPNCFATEDEEIIEINDYMLERYLIFGEYGAPQSYDENGDGKMSVTELEKIQNLELPFLPIDFSPIAYMKDLYSLTFRTYATSNLEGIEQLINLEKLESLTIQYVNLDSLEKIEKFTNLKYFSIGFMDNLTDLSSIAKLTNLKELYIYNCKNLKDISCLKDLINLTTFSITGTAVEDASVVENFTKLTELNLNSNKLKAVPNLSKIDDFSNLNYDGYKSMFIASNEITDISGFNGTNFSSIDLTNNKIEDLNCLTNVPNLDFIVVRNNLLENVENLPEQVIHIDFSNNKLTNLDFLKDVPKLQRLYVSGNQITDISGVENLKNTLEGFDASKNKIVDASVIKKLTNLNYLNLADTEIEELDVSGLEKLENLYSNNCKLNKVNFTNATNLVYVVIQNNNISDISSLEGLEKLSMLNLSTNPISDISPISNTTAKMIYLIDTLVNPYDEATFHIMCTWQENGTTYLLGDCSQFVPKGSEYTTEKIKEVTVGEEKVTVMPTEKKTTVEEILTEEKFPVIDTYTIKVLDANGNEKESNAKVGSRNVIQITDEEGQVLAEYMIVVPGDVNGDGETKIYDSFQILKDVLVSLSESIDAIEVLIRDFNEDGNVRIYDAFQYLKEAILSK